jgi:CRP-like cAMP-binding protein
VDKLGYLKKVPLFMEFKDRDLEKLAKIGQVAGFAPCEKIFTEDTSGDNLYVVLSGRVKIFAQSGAKKKTLAYLEKGEFFGEMALLDLQPRSASSVAAEACELFVVKKKDFQKLLAEYPSISLQIMKTLSRRLRQADKDIEALAFGDVLGRIASTLLELSAKYGEVTKDGCTIQMPLNQRDIAEIAGTGREMVSRTLNRFRRLKLVTYNDRYLMVIDAQKLKLFANKE